MTTFCPSLEGVNTSAKSMITFSGNIIKPDTYHNRSEGSAGSDVEKAELVVEAKFEDLDDPFDDSPSDNDFLRCSDRAMQTLGQLTSYATAHLAAQFCTHVFPFSFFASRLD